MRTPRLYIFPSRLLDIVTYKMLKFCQSLVQIITNYFMTDQIGQMKTCYITLIFYYTRPFFCQFDIRIYSFRSAVKTLDLYLVSLVTAHNDTLFSFATIIAHLANKVLFRTAANTPNLKTLIIRALRRVISAKISSFAYARKSNIDYLHLGEVSTHHHCCQILCWSHLMRGV